MAASASRRRIGGVAITLVLGITVAACSSSDSSDDAPVTVGSIAPADTSAAGTTLPDTTTPDTAPGTTAAVESTVPDSTMTDSTVPESSVTGAAVTDSIGPGTADVSELPAGMRQDDALPVPGNVRAFGDDRVITVTWDPVDDERVVGYYITYRAPDGEVKGMQTQARRGEYAELPGAVQLQPVENGVEYEIAVRAAAGTFQHTATGPLDNHTDEGSRTNSFARGDGSVSAAALTTSTPSDARVAELAARMTGFWDDFNLPAGPFDERRWNQAATACVAPGMAGAFINAQYHSHNVARSDCDRSGVVSRPRAVFDTTGATPENPAAVAIDLDGASGSRDTWYLDLLPVSAHADGLPLDLTGHNDFFDADVEGPGNMIRINARFSSLAIAYYDRDQQPRQLDMFAGETVCKPEPSNTEVSFGSCDLTAKRDGLSPLAEPDFVPLPAPNVRRHWLVQLDGSQLTVYIDSAPVAVVDLPDEFLAEQRYHVQSTIFSYNTGKGFVGVDGTQLPLIGPVDFGAMPYVQMFHWDNFGFTGPAPTEEIANYVEVGGNELGTRPYLGVGAAGNVIPSGNRAAVVPIPDPIGDLVDDTARLYFTIQPFGYFDYEPVDGDHVTVNGVRYELPEFAAESYRRRVPLADKITPISVIIPVAAADLRQGDNVVEFVLEGTDPTRAADTLNVHIELPYPVGVERQYTPPADVIGSSFWAGVHPAMTNCDQYNVVESDLGLPYPDGRPNLAVGECELLHEPDHRP